MDKNEAIKIIRSNFPTGRKMLCEALEILIPELKESEDERIRNLIYCLIRDRSDNGKLLEHNGCSVEKALAWLEKQGEQKPIYKVEPKFKVGDWIVYNDNLYHIGNIALQRYYECLRVDGTVHTFGFSIDKKSHLWTIQDAKDGDVLAVDNIIFIYKRTLASHIVSYCRLIGKKFDRFEYARTCNEGNAYVHPATEEQRNLLFQKMKEAGYEWDDEKKELKKIVQKPKIYDSMDDLIADALIEEIENSDLDDSSKHNRIFWIKSHRQKPTWSEEDDRIRYAICDTLDRTDEYIMEYNHQLTHQQAKDWLKSLKERMKGE